MASVEVTSSSSLDSSTINNNIKMNKNNNIIVSLNNNKHLDPVEICEVKFVMTGSPNNVKSQQQLLHHQKGRLHCVQPFLLNYYILIIHFIVHLMH